MDEKMCPIPDTLDLPGRWFWPVGKSYGQVSYHHLDWNSITATRVPSTADDGPDSIEIPDVDGLTAAEAYAKFAATGLPVSTTFLDNPPPGKNNTVIRVGKYRRLPRNSIIELNVYGRAVPSVINKSSGDAVGTLETVGLKVIGITVVKAPSAFLANKVFEQDPPAGVPIPAVKTARLKAYGPFEKGSAPNDAPKDKKKLFDISGVWKTTAAKGYVTSVITITVAEGGDVHMTTLQAWSRGTGKSTCDGTIVEGDEGHVTVNFTKIVTPTGQSSGIFSFGKSGDSGMTMDGDVGDAQFDAPYRRAK
jgi:PASTA domain